MRYTAKLKTPFGMLGIRAEGKWVRRIDYLARDAHRLGPRNVLSARACREIRRYLENPRHRFDLPICPAGTDFQRRIWKEVARIPSGSTRTYMDIAHALHTAPRPVGAACGANPIALVIPCHRVVASNGLGGFNHRRSGSFVEIKRWLLQHEGAYCAE